MAESDESLREKQPWKAAYEQDYAWLGGVIDKHYAGDDSDVKVLMGGILQAFAGQTVDEYAAAAAAFLADAPHPTLGRQLRDCAYVPMVELLRYLEGHGFTCFIASGGSRDFMRAITSELYGIPPERVIGSSNGLRYTDDEHGGALTYLAEPDVFDDGPVKPVRIWSRIGRRPILAGGNSNGDVPMLRFTGGRRPALRLLVLHDDPEREFDYVKGAEQSLERAKSEGWTVVSVKDDWATRLRGGRRCVGRRGRRRAAHLALSARPERPDRRVDPSPLHGNRREAGVELGRAVRAQCRDTDLAERALPVSDEQRAARVAAVDGRPRPGAPRADVRAGVVGRSGPEHVPAAGGIAEHGLAGGLEAGRPHLADRRGVGAAPPCGHGAGADARLGRRQPDSRGRLRDREPNDRDVVAVVHAKGEGSGDAVAHRGDTRRLGPVGAVGTDDGDEPTRRDPGHACAAVRTMSASISVPPQRWSPGVSARRRETMKLYEPKGAS